MGAISLHAPQHSRVHSRRSLSVGPTITRGFCSSFPVTSLLEPISVENGSFKVEIQKEAPHKEAIQVVGFFLRMLQDENADTQIRDMCFEAIKTILCGMQDDTEFGEFEEMLKEYDIVESARKEFYKNIATPPFHHIDPPLLGFVRQYSLF